MDNNFLKTHQGTTLPMILDYANNKAVDLSVANPIELMREMREEGITGQGIDSVYEALDNGALDQVSGLVSQLLEVS